MKIKVTDLTIRNEATLKDGLYYLDPDCTTSSLDTMRGQINGILTGFMAATGCSIESACSAIYAYLPKFVRVAGIPSPYRRFFNIYKDDPGDLDGESYELVWDTVNNRLQAWDWNKNKPAKEA